jgi:deoxyadenosine/deoxycytidine kinase
MAEIKNGNTHKAKVVVIIGNIASGKSTTTTALTRLLGDKASHIQEPVDAWIDNGSLQKFYEDMHTWAFPFQLQAFASRLVRFKKFTEWDSKQYLIVDGHPFSDRHVFAANLADQVVWNNNPPITPYQLKLYEEQYNDWAQIVPEAIPDVVIYIRTDPKEAFARKTKRDRLEESPIVPDYMNQLHARLEHLWANKDTLINKKISTTFHEIDGNSNILDTLDRALSAIKAHERHTISVSV